MLNRYAMETYRGVEAKLHALLTTAADEGELSASYSDILSLANEPPIPIGEEFGGAQSWSGSGGV